MKTYSKEYKHEGYNVKVKYNNTKSINEYLEECVNTSFVPKILEELETLNSCN